MSWRHAKCRCCFHCDPLQPCAGCWPTPATAPANASVVFAGLPMCITGGGAMINPNGSFSLSTDYPTVGYCSWSDPTGINARMVLSTDVNGICFIRRATFPPGGCDFSFFNFPAGFCTHGGTLSNIFGAFDATATITWGP